MYAAGDHRGRKMMRAADNARNDLGHRISARAETTECFRPCAILLSERVSASLSPLLRLYKQRPLASLMYSATVRFRDFYRQNKDEDTCRGMPENEVTGLLYFRFRSYIQKLKRCVRIEYRHSGTEKIARIVARFEGLGVSPTSAESGCAGHVRDKPATHGFKRRPLRISHI